MRLLFWIALLLSFVITEQTNYAWTSTQGNWSDLANWSPMGVPTFADDVTIASTSAKVHVTAATGSMVLKNAGTIILHDNLGATSGDASYRGTFTFVADSTNPTPTLSILSSLTFGQLDAQKGKLATRSPGNPVSWLFPNNYYATNQNLEIAEGRIQPSGSFWWDSSNITSTNSDFSDLTGLSNSNFTINVKPPFTLVGHPVQFINGSRVIVYNCAALLLSTLELDASSAIEAHATTVSITNQAFNLTYLLLDSLSNMTATNANLITGADPNHATQWTITGGSKFILSQSQAYLGLNVQLSSGSQFVFDQSNLTFQGHSTFSSDSSSTYAFTASNVTVDLGTAVPPVKSAFKSRSTVSVRYLSDSVDWTFDGTSTLTMEHSSFAWQTTTTALPWASTTKVTNLGNSSITWIPPIGGGVGLVSLSSATLNATLPSGSVYTTSGTIAAPVIVDGQLLLSSGSSQLISYSITGSGQIVATGLSSFQINSISLIEPPISVTSSPTQAKGQVTTLNLTNSAATLLGTLSGTNLNLNNANFTNSTSSSYITFDNLALTGRLWITTTPITVSSAALQNAFVDAYLPNWYTEPHLTVISSISIDSNTIFRVVVSQLLPITDQAHSIRIFKLSAGISKRQLLALNVELYTVTAENQLRLLGDCFSYDVDSSDGSVTFSSKVPATTGCAIYADSPPSPTSPPLSAPVASTTPSGSPSSETKAPSKQKSDTGLIVGIVVGVIAAGLVIAALIIVTPILYRKYQYSKDDYHKSSGVEMQATPTETGSTATAGQANNRWTRSAKPAL